MTGVRGVGVAAIVALLGVTWTTSCNPPFGSCAESECSGEGALSCRDNKVMVCTLYEGDPCTYHYLTVEDDCNSFAEDARCSNAGCVLAGERCPAGVSGFCRDQTLFHCDGDRVLARSRNCAQGGLGCWDSSNGGPPGGVCALETERCRSSEAYSSECRGDERVRCQDGYAVEKTPCSGVEHCREVGPVGQLAQCTPDIACPPDGGTVCDWDQVYGCEPGSAPAALRDCRPRGDACEVVSGRALCTGADWFSPSYFRAVAGGTYSMGPADPPDVIATVSDFEMLDQEVTVGEYSACMLEGRCTAPDNACEIENSRRPDLDANLPVTCVTMEQAATYCGFAGGYLPDEGQWEYAFRNRGEDVTFPWGDEPATCDYAILAEPFTEPNGCRRGEPWPGCSTGSDQTKQGICDLAGNVREWVIPTVAGFELATRGGGFDGQDVDGRESHEAAGPSGSIGFRCAR